MSVPATGGGPASTREQADAGLTLVDSPAVMEPAATAAAPAAQETPSPRRRRTAHRVRSARRICALASGGSGPRNLLAPLGSSRPASSVRVVRRADRNLAVMLALIAIGIASPMRRSGDEPHRVLVWNIWWPFLVITAFFAARLWCSMCHLRRPRILRQVRPQAQGAAHPEAIWHDHPVASVLGIFVVHSIVVSYGSTTFRTTPPSSSAGLMVYAAGIGLVFEKNSFCKYFCPLVGVLGNYTRVSPTELRSADKAQCKRCKDKACIKNCQNRLYMGTMDDEQQESCLLCMRCVKHCPHDNIRFSPRPYLRGLWQSPKRTLSGTFAVLVLLGIVMGEVGEGWALVDGVAPGRSFAHRRADRVRTHPSPDHHPGGFGEGYLIWETAGSSSCCPLRSWPSAGSSPTCW